ncbi:hypothetical protein ATKI12_8057 [Kitasatospora sp. Ki12]
MSERPVGEGAEFESSSAVHLTRTPRFRRPNPGPRMEPEPGQDRTHHDHATDEVSRLALTRPCDRNVRNS